MAKVSKPQASTSKRRKCQLSKRSTNSQISDLPKRREVNIPSGNPPESLDEPFSERPPSRANVHQTYLKQKLKTSDSTNTSKIKLPNYNCSIRNEESKSKTFDCHQLQFNSPEIKNRCDSERLTSLQYNKSTQTEYISFSSVSTSTLVISEGESGENLVQAIQEKLNEREDLLKRLEQVIKSQHDEIQNQRSFISKLQSDVGDSNAELYSKLEHTRDILVEKESVIEGLKNKLSSTYVNYEKAIQRSITAEKEITTLRSEIGTVLESKKWLQKQLDSATTSRTDLQNKLSQIQAKNIENVSALERMRAEKERASQALVAAQQQALREKQFLALHLETIEADIVQKEVELTQAKLECATLEKSENTHSSLHLDMQQELENLRTSLRLSVKQLEEEQILKAEFAHRLALAHEMTVERDRRITHLKDTMSDNEKLQMDLTEQLKISDNIRKQAEKKVSVLEEALERVQKNLISVREHVVPLHEPISLSQKVTMMKSKNSNDNKTEILNVLTEAATEFKLALGIVEDYYEEVQICLSQILPTNFFPKYINENVDSESSKKNYNYIKTKAKRKSRQREIIEIEKEKYETRLTELSKKIEELTQEKDILQDKLETAVAEKKATTSKLVLLQRNKQDLRYHLSQLEGSIQTDTKPGQSNLYNVSPNSEMKQTEKENLLLERKNLQMKLKELLHEREADIIHSRIVQIENQSLSTQLEELLCRRQADSEKRFREIEELYELRMKEWQADCTNREISLKLQYEELEHKNTSLLEKVRDFDRLQELVAVLQKNYREQAELRSEAEKLLKEKDVKQEFNNSETQTEHKDSFLIELIRKLQSFKQAFKNQDFANGDSGIEDNVTSVVTLSELSRASKAACEENPSLSVIVRTYQQIIELIADDSGKSSDKTLTYEISHKNCLATSEKNKLENIVRDLQHELECASSMHNSDLLMLNELRQSELNARKECNEHENTIRRMKTEMHRLTTDLDNCETKIPILQQQLNECELLLNSKDKELLAQEDHIKNVEERFVECQSSLNSTVRQSHTDLELCRNNLRETTELNSQLKNKVVKLTEVLKTVNTSQDLKTYVKYSDVGNFLECHSADMSKKSHSSLGVLQSCLNGLRSQITTLQSQVNGHLLKVQSSTKAWR